MHWPESYDVARRSLPAAWRINLCPAIIATVLREMLTSAFNLSRAVRPQIGEINSIPEGTGVVPPPIDHLVARFVKPLSQI